MSAFPDTTPGFAEAHPVAVRVPLWKRGWFRLIVLAVIATFLLCAAFVGLVNVRSGDRLEDPTSYRAGGAAALSNLIQAQGVAVTPTSDVGRVKEMADPDTTVVLVEPELSRAEFEAILLRKPADVIVVSPSAETLTDLGSPATVVFQDTAPGELLPGCSDPDALRAGSVIFDYSPVPEWGVSPFLRSNSPAVTTCFRSSTGGAGYARYREGETTVHLLAGGLHNSELDRSGNAAFTMALFGRHPRLVWLQIPQVIEDPVPGQDAGEPILVLPQGWGWAVAMSLFTLGVVALWRGRRLGPILEENLPVRVRASETVEGHGRLYFRNDARARAADILRSATVARLESQFGQSDQQALVSLISARLGVPDAQIGELLFGAPPGTDAELIGLQDWLQHLEQEVRRL